jgi:hypothetical protein
LIFMTSQVLSYNCQKYIIIQFEQFFNANRSIRVASSKRKLSLPAPYITTGEYWPARPSSTKRLIIYAATLKKSLVGIKNSVCKQQASKGRSHRASLSSGAPAKTKLPSILIVLIKIASYSTRMKFRTSLCPIS